MSFADPDHMSNIRLPSEVRVESRANLITARYDAINHQTSDSFISLVTNQIGTTYLFKCEHLVVDDGTLLTNRIESLENTGCLWNEAGSLPAPLLSEVRQRKPPNSSVNALHTSDPLAGRVKQPKGSSKRQSSAPSGLGSNVKGSRAEKPKTERKVIPPPKFSSSEHCPIHVGAELEIGEEPIVSAPGLDAIGLPPSDLLDLAENELPNGIECDPVVDLFFLER